MPEVNEKVMSMVEEELRKNPKATTAELKEKAEKVDKGVAKLTNREFHARYPLQVKRRAAPAKPRRPARRAARRPTRSETPEGRTAIRGVLLDFARAVAAAEGKADVVDVIGGVDRYVDRVLKATNSG